MLALTAEFDRSICTDPLVVSEMPLLVRPPPMKTESAEAKVPPGSSPTACACRSISVSTDLNSVFSVSRSPVNVPEADCVASVRARSISSEMLLRPPSMVCKVLKPSAAFRMPCRNTAMSDRKRLAIANPAASSAEELIRKPEVNLVIVRCCRLFVLMRFSWAIKEDTLVTMENPGMVIPSLVKIRPRVHSRPAGPGAQPVVCLQPSLSDPIGIC